MAGDTATLFPVALLSVKTLYVLSVLSSELQKFTFSAPPDGKIPHRVTVQRTTTSGRHNLTRATQTGYGSENFQTTDR